MRSVVFTLALMLVTASAAHAQQTLAPSPATEPAAQSQQALVPAAAPSPDARAAEAPVGLTRSDAVLKPVQTDRAKHASGASMDPTARNMFTIIGVVVVVIALVALLT
jgi:hypothetical protein